MRGYNQRKPKLQREKKKYKIRGISTHLTDLRGSDKAEKENMENMKSSDVRL